MSRSSSSSSGSRSRQWPQYMAAITATLSLAVTGAHIGWTSPTLPALKEPGSPLPISSNDASWIASFYLLGSIPGNVLAAFTVDSLGRKSSLLLAGLPLSLSWPMIAFARHPYALYGARFVAGLGQGLVYVCCPMYIGEIAEPRIRGSLGTFIKLMVTAGELYARALGAYVPYECLAWSCLLLPVGFFLSFGWMPESPYYLLMRSRRAEAERSLRRLRGPGRSPDELQEDLDQMEKAAIRELRDRGGLADLWRVRGNRRASLVCLGLQLVLQASGIAAVESYAQEILQGSEAEVSAPVAVIALSVVQLGAGLGAAVLVDRAGRRPLLLATTLLAGVALGAAGLFYLLKLRLGLEMSPRLGLVLVAAIFGYELAVALGLSPLPYMMLGELFPTSVKGSAVSLANVWASLLAFVVSKMYQVLADAAGIETSFGCFAAACFVGMVFIYLFVPETKGKSLLEIQQELNLKRGKAKPKIKLQTQLNTIA